MAEQSAHSARLVLDTNIVVAGLLWNGPPRQLLDLAIDDTVALYSSPVLLDELAHTLAYAKFAARIARFGTTVDALHAQYTALVTRITLATGAPARVSRDADDDHVIACAVAARADALVSGDQDLLVLGEHRGVRIVTARDALTISTRA